MFGFALYINCMAANNAKIFQFFMSCFSLVIIRFRVSVEIYCRIFNSLLVKGQRAAVIVVSILVPHFNDIASSQYNGYR